MGFAAGEPTKIFTVPILNDQVLETNETFQVELRNPSAGFISGASTNQTCTVTIVDATGLEARRFEGIQPLANGAIRLELAGGVSKPFSEYYSIFQIEASSDLAQWRPLPLLGYLNGSSEPPAYIAHCVVTLTPAGGSGTITIHQQCQFATNPIKGRWEIVSGTGDYADLKGNGSLLMPGNDEDMTGFIY